MNDEMIRKIENNMKRQLERDLWFMEKTTEISINIVVGFVLSITLLFSLFVLLIFLK